MKTMFLTPARFQALRIAASSGSRPIGGAASPLLGPARSFWGGGGVGRGRGAGATLAGSAAGSAGVGGRRRGGGAERAGGLGGEGVVGAGGGRHAEQEGGGVRPGGAPPVDPAGREAVASAVDEGAHRHRLVLLPGPPAAGGE